MSASNNKLAVVNEHNTLLVYDLNSKELLFQVCGQGFGGWTYQDILLSWITVSEKDTVSVVTRFQNNLLASVFN